MGILKKAVVFLGGMLSIATIAVATKNAVDVNKVTPKHTQGFYEKYVKRPQDFMLASASIVVLSPVLVATAVAVRINLGSPVLFTQERPGQGGKIFKLYKFRTMTDEKDVNGNMLPDEDRLTAFGQTLRSTSIDHHDIIRQTTETPVNTGLCGLVQFISDGGRDHYFLKTQMAGAA